MTTTTEVTDIYNVDPLMTVDEAAQYLAVSKSTVNRYRREGLLPVVRIMADCRFRRSDLNRFIQTNVKYPKEQA